MPQGWLAGWGKVSGDKETGTKAATPKHLSEVLYLAVIAMYRTTCALSPARKLPPPSAWASNRSGPLQTALEQTVGACDTGSSGRGRPWCDRRSKTPTNQPNKPTTTRSQTRPRQDRETPG